MQDSEALGAGPLAAFTKLKIGELMPVAGLGDDSPAGSDRWATPDHGLLSREVFERYSAGSNGRLGVSELHWLLRDHGIKLDYAGTCRTLSGVTNRGEHSIDFDCFSRVVTEAGTHRHGYTEEVIILLHGIFNSYDRNHSGFLERQECLRLLADAGRKADTVEETRQLLALISSCRSEGAMGPLCFDQFLTLLQRLSRDRRDVREGEDGVLL